MNGCRCGCGGEGSGPRSTGHGPEFARWPSREERIERLEEHQRDLEQRTAEVADEINRVKSTAEPAS